MDLMLSLGGLIFAEGLIIALLTRPITFWHPLALSAGVTGWMLWDGSTARVVGNPFPATFSGGYSGGTPRDPPVTVIRNFSPAIRPIHTGGFLARPIRNPRSPSAGAGQRGWPRFLDPACPQPNE